MGSEIRRVGKSNSVYIISVSERYYFSCAFDCATDSDNVSMIINLQTVPRFVSPPGPCSRPFPIGFSLFPVSRDSSTCLRTASGLLVGNRKFPSSNFSVQCKNEVLKSSKY